MIRPREITSAIRSLFLSALLALFAGTALAGEDRDTNQVRAEMLDGTTVSGAWIGMSDGGHVELHTPAGPQHIKLHDLSEVFLSEPRSLPAGPIKFYLADGGYLSGSLLDAAADAVVAATALGSHLTMPYDRLAGVQLVGEGEFELAEGLFRRALGDRLPSEDVLITRDREDPKELRGRLERLGPNEGTFVFAGHPRTLQTDRLFGVIFAAGAGTRTAYALSFELADGSRFFGRLEAADHRSFRIATSLAGTVEVPVEAVSRIRVRSGRVVYLSDLPVATQRLEGRLHRPWPPQQDRSVSGAILSIDGNRFDKGLGVHSRTELTYDLDGGYEMFLATVGLDDAVRPRGSVVFSVLGDGAVLWDGGEITGREPPRHLAVKIVGVGQLTLLVDYGAGLDLSDHADWGGARLLRPADYQPTR